MRVVDVIGWHRCAVKRLSENVAEGRSWKMDAETLLLRSRAHPLLERFGTLSEGDHTWADYRQLPHPSRPPSERFADDISTLEQNLTPSP
jgi:hypothetical protein